MAWRSLTKAAGFRGFRFHDLRHIFITHMVERGASLGELCGETLVLTICSILSR
jgi:integrase